MWNIKALYAIAIIGTASGGRILAIFPMEMRSHFEITGKIARLLAENGHDVTVISPYAKKDAIANYTDVDVSGRTNLFGQAPCRPNYSNFGTPKTMSVFISYEIELCKSVYKNRNFRKFALDNKHTKFDVILLEPYNVNCFLPLAEAFDSTIINVMTFRSWPITNWAIGNPENPAYLPRVLGRAGAYNSNSFDRFLGVFDAVWMYASFFLYSNRMNDEAFKKHFYPYGIVDDILTDRIALTFYHSHFSLQSKPMVPNAVEIAGIHLEDRSTYDHLSRYQELKIFLDGADSGAILFALGSVVNSSCIDTDKIQSYMEAFAEIPQRVLWKYENTRNLSVPKNVLLTKWLPQIDILHHENVIAFICHGGITSIYEAIHAGKPIIGIPFRVDQFSNLALLEEKRVAIVLDFHKIDKSTLLVAIRNIISNGYYSRMLKLCREFNDRPVSSSKLVLHWTEYVIKHRTSFRQNPSASKSICTSLPLYEYFFIDIILLIIVFCLFLLVTVVLFFIAARKFMEFRKYNH